MSDKFSTISINHLFHLLLMGDKNGLIFGIPKELFFVPKDNDPYRFYRFGKLLENPVGVAAGPHTQLAQNILCAWLCGARYMELKTVQTLDDLEIYKPCIDMQDEGYNCEWSQELKLRESYEEYLKAWVLIHVLRNKYGHTGELGTIFNMSVGYDLAGIKNDNMQWFLNKMNDCSMEKESVVRALKTFISDIDDIPIPKTISDNVTLSTMHGCPPDEIEKIGLYLIEEKKLHTTIKLNPTLLGPEVLRKILNTQLEYPVEVPDIAFEHDLKYPNAVNLIKSLQNAANRNNVSFGIKLTNTLESVNNRTVFNKEQAGMMYMSGRALHPIAVNLAKKLQNDFNGELDISFSAGADCFNIADLIACGLKPVTVSSDVLKPGGYGRIKQYTYKLKEQFTVLNANSIESFILKTDGTTNLNAREAALLNLNKYADDVLKNKAYKKDNFRSPDIKTDRKLKHFDCIKAPCVTTCPTHQDIPEYLYHTAQGDAESAFRVIMRTNPFPSVLGMVCDHACQSKCTRSNYDNSLLIREIKRFVTEKARDGYDVKRPEKNGLKVAVIGAGPSGLSCAHFLALSGFEVNVYEKKAFSGGMISDAIPAFRLSNEAIRKDIEKIEKLGVKINYNYVIDKDTFEKLRSQNDFVYLAVGAQEAKRMNMENEDAEGILDPLLFLSDVRNNSKVSLGKKIAVLGGGNTAMDAARTALRVAGEGSCVTILYRRTKKEMPADVEELYAALNEGIEIIELVAPEKIITENNKVKAMQFSKMKLSEADESGRARPVKIEGSEFEMEFDNIIPAFGQDVIIDFIDNKLLTADPFSYETKIEKVYIGGDALRGAATVIKAVADGRKVAENILMSAQKEHPDDGLITIKERTLNEHIVSRSIRLKGLSQPEPGLSGSINFDITQSGLTEKEAINEAARCLYCDDVCSICETVCPNRANYTFSISPVNYNLQKAIRKGNGIIYKDDRVFSVKQSYQVINIGDFCNECGNCTTFCPSSGAPYKDKPKLYLGFKSFNSSDGGYFINTFGGNTTIMHKQGREIKTLTASGDIYLFDTTQVVAKLNVKDFSIIEASFKNPELMEADFEDAAEMSILLHYLKELYFTDFMF